MCLFVLRGFCVHVLKLFEFLIGAAVNTDTDTRKKDDDATVEWKAIINLRTSLRGSAGVGKKMK